MKQIPLKCGKRVTDSSQAVIYIFSPDFVEIAIFLACNASAKLPISNQCRVRMPQTFSLLPVPIFFSQNFFSEFFYSRAFYSRHRCLPVYRDKKDSLCICVMKNMIRSKRSKLDFRLVWCVKYSCSAHTTHITLDVKSPIYSPCCMIYYYYYFFKPAIFNWSTQMFFRWHLIAKYIKFCLEVRTRQYYSVWS